MTVRATLEELRLHLEHLRGEVARRRAWHEDAVAKLERAEEALRLAKERERETSSGE